MKTPETLASAAALDSGPEPVAERLFSASAHAHAAWLGLRAIKDGGALDAPTRRRIGVALAARCGSPEMLAAQSAAARAAGLTGDEIAANRAGSSQDARAARAVQAACVLAGTDSGVPVPDLARLRAAGYGNAELAELVAHAGLARLEALSLLVARERPDDLP